MPPSESRNLREREVQGFARRFAELVAEGDWFTADFVAGCAMRIANTTDEEYEQILAEWGPIN